MKRYIKVQSSSKEEIFNKAKDQRCLNEIYRSLNNLVDAMNDLSTEKFNEIGLDLFYKTVLDKIQDMYPYYKG